LSKDLHVIGGIVAAIVAITVWMNYANTFHDFMSYTSSLSQDQKFQLGIQGFASLFQPISFFGQTFPLAIVLIAAIVLGALWQRSR
jgi:hypothetical protein